MRSVSAIALLATLFVSRAVDAAALPRFTQPNSVWNRDVSGAPLRSNSTLMMQHLEQLATLHIGSGNWGGDSLSSNHDFQIDFSFYALHATNLTVNRAIVAYPDAGSYYSTDCEDPGFLFPVPPGGGIEGTGPPNVGTPPAYTCDTSNNDCHLLVGNDQSNVLYESYSVASADATGVHATCGLSWDLTRVYPRYGRGEHCTSADGAGFPIAPLLFNADDVWAAAQTHGDLGHAIRFILGNSRMMQKMYVHPSSHGTLATSDTDVNAVPYGSHLRLKASFNVATFSSNEAVRVLLRTLQKYGMFLSDGGSIPLTGESDYYDAHHWTDPDVNIDSQSLYGINPTDFEVVQAGDPITVTYNCVRTPADFLFIDGYDF